MEQESNDVVITDANILIDYCKSDKKILRLFTEEICQIYVPTIILNQFVQLPEKEAEQIGLKLFEPTFKQVLEASEKGGSLSFQDKLCFIISRDKKWACVTNDEKAKMVEQTLLNVVKITEETIAAKANLDHDLMVIKEKTKDLKLYLIKMKEVHKALDAYIQSEKAGEKVVKDLLNQPSIKALLSNADELIPKVQSGIKEIQTLINKM